MGVLYSLTYKIGQIRDVLYTYDLKSRIYRSRGVQDRVKVIASCINIVEAVTVPPLPHEPVLLYSS